MQEVWFYCYLLLTSLWVPLFSNSLHLIEQHFCFLTSFLELLEFYYTSGESFWAFSLALDLRISSGRMLLSLYSEVPAFVWRSLSSLCAFFLLGLPVG